MPAASARRHIGFTGDRTRRWGALALLVRPAYIAIELVVVAATTGGYSVVADAVSRLGEVGCSAAYCSPHHELMNGSFMVFGALLAGGAVLRTFLGVVGHGVAGGLRGELGCHGTRSARPGRDPACDRRGAVVRRTTDRTNSSRGPVQE